MKRGEILDAVKNTITKDRNDRHGEPENSFPRIAKAWSDYLKRLGWVEPKLKPSDVAEMLAIFKTCRFETQPDNPDNEHDRIGYYAIAAELRAKERMEGLDWTEIKPITPEVEPKGTEVSRIFTGLPFPQKPDFPGEIIAMAQTNGKLLKYQHSEAFGWVNIVDAETLASSAAQEVTNGGPPPTPPGFPPRPPKHKNDTTIHENKIFEARKRHGTNDLFWIYGGEAPGTPNRKPNFEGEIWVCDSGNFKGFEWTAIIRKPKNDLIWFRTK